jgi:DNA replication and repair protein RecF
MVLKNLEIENFRNFSHLKVNFGEGINIISGMNGQGKTSILESIYYLALTKSFRTSNDNHVITYTKDNFNITSTINPDIKTSRTVRLYYSGKEGKHLFVNQKEVEKFSEYIGSIPSVILTLDDMKLTLGGPQERRRFLDILISQVSPVYLADLKIYRRTIQQRNALLSQDDREAVKKQISIWNEQLVKHGTEIIIHRLKFCDFLNNHLSDYYNNISGVREQINIDYNSTISDQIADINEKKIRISFEKKLDMIFNYEFERKTSVIGPHRDDINFKKDAKVFKNFCSQGENKTLVVALKFLEWEYISKERKITPVLLLDDIFGELDENRMYGLLKFLEKIGQAYITTTMQNKFKNHITSNKYILRDKKIYDA